MPGKSKEDTWGAKELTDSIREARSSGKSRHKEKDRDRDKDRDREKRKDKDRDRERHKDKDRSHDKEREKDRHRDKDRERDKDKPPRDKERDKDRQRDKERDRDRDRHRDKERDREKEKHRDRDKDGERRKDRERDSSREKERSKRRERESSREKERSRDGERSKDGDRRRDKDREKDRDKDKRDRSHRERKDDKNRESSDRRSEKERHRDREDRKKDRENGAGSQDRDKDRDKSRDGDRDRRKEEKSRHREKDKDKDRRRREKEGTDSDRDREKRSRHRDRDGSVDGRKKERDDGKTREEQKRTHKEERSRENHEDGVTEEIIQKVEQPADEQAFESNHKDANNDYEDDFEDYDDDDFEDDDGEDDDDSYADDKVASEIDEMRKAMAAENQAMRKSADSQSSRSRSERSSAASNTRPTTSRTGGRTFINFVAAKQRQISSQVSQRTRKRGQELMNLIDLDTSAYDLFDMPPVREYDRYIASFGRSDTKQAFVQCNEDNLEREVQTEEIEGWDKWTQHPPEGAMVSGGTSKEEVDSEIAVEKETNSLHYNHFLEKVTQLFAVLLDEEMANRVGGKLEANKRSIIFSDGYTLMNTGTPILQGRCVSQVVFHPVQTNLILTMHSMPKKKVVEKAGLTNRGLMCVWNINEPSRPQKILVLKSVPTTCTFSPSKATMAFCGTLDGSVCVWDLREPSSMHQKCEFGWGHIVVRVPTYSTEAGMPSDESHHCPVVAMQPIVSAEDTQKSTAKSSVRDDSVGLSFQLASVDERGTISFWVVIEIDKPEEAGSESDLGLVPSGRIKLIKSSSIQLHIPSRELGPIYQLKVSDMQLMPANPNHFFVSTDAGFVSHGARNTERVSPKYFWVNEGQFMFRAV